MFVRTPLSLQKSASQNVWWLHRIYLSCSICIITHDDTCWQRIFIVTQWRWMQNYLILLTQWDFILLLHWLIWITGTQEYFWCTNWWVIVYVSAGLIQKKMTRPVYAPKNQTQLIRNSGHGFLLHGSIVFSSYWLTVPHWNHSIYSCVLHYIYIRCYWVIACRPTSQYRIYIYTHAYI